MSSSLSQSTDSIDQACDADMAPSTPVAAVPAASSYSELSFLETKIAALHTIAVTNGSAGVLPTNGDETDTSVLGMYICL